MSIDAIIFDYHGTLVNSYSRFTESYAKAIEYVCDIEIFDKNSIVEMKRNGVSSEEIINIILKHLNINASENIIKKVNRIRRQLILNPAFFCSYRDLLISGIKTKLFELKEKHIKLFLVTLLPVLDVNGGKTMKKAIMNQMKKFCIYSVFDDIFLQDVPYGNDFIQAKYEAFRAIMEKNNITPKKCLVVGDLDVELKAAKKLGMKTVGVLSGFSNRKRLEEIGVDEIISSVSELRIQ